MTSPTTSEAPQPLVIPTTDELRDMMGKALLGSMINALDDGGRIITGDEVRFHTGDEKFMVFPKGTTYDRAIEILQAKRAEEDVVTTIERTFLYRPDDGANAAANVLQRMYGLTLGKSTPQLFGPDTPPSIKTINIGHGKTRQVPWEKIGVPALPGADINLLMVRNAIHGLVFYVKAEAPKRYSQEIERFFDAIDLELRENSIYRGKAMVGSDELTYLDLSTFDPTKIVFADDVTATLDAYLYGPIRYAAALEEDGTAPRRAILLHGPFGTGKSSIGAITGQIAEQHGWTFLMARPGQDGVEDAMRTAALYEPAVVFVEDIDAQASSSNPKAVTELLEAFDGITAKSRRIILVATTNHIETIHAGMLRPGRFDHIIEVASLDRGGSERLIRALVDPAKLDPKVNFDLVYEQMTGFEPAFVAAAGVRAKTFALTRAHGSLDYVLETQDLCLAARSLHSQLELLRAASEGTAEPELTAAMTNLIAEQLNRTSVVDTDDGYERQNLAVKDEVNPLSHK